MTVSIRDSLRKHLPKSTLFAVDHQQKCVLILLVSAPPLALSLLTVFLFNFPKEKKKHYGCNNCVIKPVKQQICVSLSICCAKCSSLPLF